MRPIRQSEFIEDEPRLVEEWVPYILATLSHRVLDRTVASWQPQGDPNRVRCSITLRESLARGSDTHVRNGTLREITPLGVQCRCKEIFGRGVDTMRPLASA